MALLQNGHLDEAIATAERALERFPENQNVPYVLMQAKLARDANPKAVLAISPETLEGWIARFVLGEIDALLPPGGATPEQAAGLGATLLRVKLLRLAGRESAAQAMLAARAQDISERRARLANPSISSHDKARLHVNLAYWAALSGETAQALEHVAQALNNPPSGDQFAFHWMLSSAERTMGNAQVAWLLIEPYAGVSINLSHGHLRAFKPFYDKVYGKSPSYQAYISKIAGEKQ